MNFTPSRQTYYVLAAPLITIAVTLAGSAWLFELPYGTELRPVRWFVLMLAALIVGTLAGLAVAVRGFRLMGNGMKVASLVAPIVPWALFYRLLKTAELERALVWRNE